MTSVLSGHSTNADSEDEDDKTVATTVYDDDYSYEEDEEQEDQAISIVETAAAEFSDSSGLSSLRYNNYFFNLQLSSELLKLDGRRLLILGITENSNLILTLVRNGDDSLTVISFTSIEHNDTEKKELIISSAMVQVLNQFVPLVFRCFSATHPTFQNPFEKIRCMVIEQIMSIHTRCVVCTIHVEGAGIRPGPCSNSLCSHSFVEHGIGFSLEQNLLNDPNVFDILIVFLYAASAVGGRISLFFPRDLLNDDSSQNIALLREILELVPSVEEMCGHAKKSTLRQHLDALHPLMYRILRSMITSNRCFVQSSHVSCVADNLDKKSFTFTVNVSPERETEFARLKRNTPLGSFVAFHGASLGSFTSILGNGLKNMSGTTYQSHGALYGNGVYLADEVNLAKSYSGIRTNSVWPKSCFGRDISVVAGCEVIHRQEEMRGTRKTEGFAVIGGTKIFIVKDESYIIPRFLLVNPRHHDMKIKERLVSLLPSVEFEDGRKVKRCRATENVSTSIELTKEKRNDETFK